MAIKQKILTVIDSRMYEDDVEVELFGDDNQITFTYQDDVLLTVTLADLNELVALLNKMKR